ncbi:hypothetical protein Q2T91_21780 [Ralstonia pseudosolanacearum]|uniref:hypothetical protein n=1 Tax=Ralstonia pseudosolanacearum TaxID=1310165 RepID=UPI00399B25B3
MEITEGYLAAWAATARALEHIEPSELDLLPDIADSATRSWRRIRSLPGAFDFDLVTAQTMAATLFPLVLGGINFAAPKLFEAAIDVGKDSIKRLVEHRLAAKANTSAPQPKIDVVRLREVVRVAALERRLSPNTADIIANAVIAQIAIEKVT